MTKLRGISGLLIPLILGTFRDSQTLDVAMSSRAFGAPGKRTFLMESHFRPVDYIIVIMAILILLGGIALRLLGYGTL
jgi:energy-coupling factor transporter transmembrane protein EcfT